MGWNRVGEEAGDRRGGQRYPDPHNTGTRASGLIPGVQGVPWMV